MLEYQQRRTLELCTMENRARSAPPALAALRDELLAMSARDQAVREAGIKDPAADRSEWKAVDDANLARMKEIVAEHGFPTVEMVGARGVHEAWLLVQHADSDHAFQKDMLERLRALNLPWLAGDVAFLTDRVRVGDRAPQVYGTQYGWPIEDREHVDERRAQAGLEPLACYNGAMERSYGPPK